MEAIGYCLMFFLRGSLPWQGLKAKIKREKYRKILEQKQATVPFELCRGYPSPFVDYFNYCRNLGFEEKPDYAFLKKLFQDLLESQGFEYDGRFDWIIKKEEAKGTYDIKHFHNEASNVFNHPFSTLCSSKG
jgi:hypothetical protein